MHQRHVRQSHIGTSQTGFSLVELAIALMIIGVLLGAVMKGRELITNSRITSVIKQVQSYSAASKIFESTYRDLAGDMVNPGARIVGCTTAPCTTSGNGSGTITAWAWSDHLPDSYIISTENRNFWMHMARAGMISGVDANNTSSAFTGWGAELPAAPFNNMGFIANGPYINKYSYSLMLRSQNIITSRGEINALLASQIDNKMDDGKPITGLVQQYPYSFGCTVGAGVATAYNIELLSSGCFMIFTSN